jgi:hypothetical protein
MGYAPQNRCFFSVILGETELTESPYFRAIVIIGAIDYVAVWKCF